MKTAGTMRVEKTEMLTLLGTKAAIFLGAEYRKFRQCPLCVAEYIMDSLLCFPRHKDCRVLFARVNRHVRRHAPQIAARYRQFMREVQTVAR